MKQKLLLKSMLLLFALIAGSSSVWATDVLYYTLDGTVAGSGSAYNSANAISQNEMNWKVTGNTQMTPWRIGGKSTSNVDRPVYSETAMGAVISKVEFNFGATISTQLTINSVTLTVSTASNGGGTVIDEVVKTSGFSANGTLTFNPSAGKEWSKNSYYKLTFNIKTDNTSSNYFLQFKNAKFYTQSYEITAVSNDDSYGTVSLEGFTITATPEYGYRVISGDGGYTVSSGTATVTNNGDNTFTVAPTSDCTITINFEEIPFYTATFSVNGVEDGDYYYEGENIVFPSNPSIGGLTFMGWVKTPIVGSTDTAPTSYETSGVMGTADVTYYAVFAKSETGTTTVTDELTYSLIGVTGNSYTGWDNTQDQTDAVYIGCTAGGNDAIQLNSSTSTSKRGIITTTSGGTLKKVTVEWNTNTANARTLEIYGSNSAYTTISDFNDDKGTKIGQVVKGTSTEVTPDDDYEYIGFYATGALYLNKISIDWETTGTIYSAYRTTIPTALTPGKEYTTLTSAENLDFTNVTGLEAYIATAVAGGSVQMTQVNKVPANTGLVLKATTPGSAVYVPVFDGTGADNVSANKMAGSATETTAIAANGGYILKDGVFQPALAGTLPAGKAYLNIAYSPAAPILNLGFDDATGINAVNGEGFTVNGEFYNLNGQRVAQPTKGLYIVNGKKYIVK